ncbi:hypothetical protein CALVIDRAFT_220760 [Calocera viscosa TUFC12733]|uniref:Transmembrane protein n=1 Tax=Calocera viscosa (strain TUFC12733) TaxID=1330018 RepID=A0A167RKI0_CALVF|nr:hypothetical protein CALVIDRAFT_220760 [Calocera viscosa TUFC12733]
MPTLLVPSTGGTIGEIMIGGGVFGMSFPRRFPFTSIPHRPQRPAEFEANAKTSFSKYLKLMRRGCDLTCLSIIHGRFPSGKLHVYIAGGTALLVILPAFFLAVDLSEQVSSCSNGYARCCRLPVYPMSPVNSEDHWYISTTLRSPRPPHTFVSISLNV